VNDVAAALDTMLNAPLTSTASTFALPGPQVYTYNDILHLLSFISFKPFSSAPTIPKPIALALSNIVNRVLWWPVVSPDEVERRFINDAGVEAFDRPAADAGVPSGWVEPNAFQEMQGVDGEPVKSWTDLKMVPDKLEEHALLYLRPYRSALVLDFY
jgi:NADH dehydrogenase (ubiquinone) 1 alpha subcomplex subunit 9